MDLFSGLFGDVTDDSMYVSVPVFVGAATRWPMSAQESASWFRT
jgi:hypothetical protein